MKKTFRMGVIMKTDPILSESLNGSLVSNITKYHTIRTSEDGEYDDDYIDVYLEGESRKFNIREEFVRDVRDSKAIYHFILNDEILSDAFRYISLNNVSNNAPYHHFQHMITVTKWCLYLSKLEGVYPYTKEFYELLLAAMFHDMNHSMGKEKDDYNVTQAILAFHSWNTNKDISGKKVEEIIRATEYPYVIESDKLTIQQRIIRDADLMVWLEDDWFQNAILGLNKEMDVNDIIKVIEGNLEFHKNIKMCTLEGKVIYDTQWDEHVFTPINNLIKVLKK
jgi:hypothetical protein